MTSRKKKMTQQKIEFTIPLPTKVQLERTERMLKVMGISIGAVGVSAYEEALLQVLTDITNIDNLVATGVNLDQPFAISHLAYFQELQDAQRFAKLVHCSGYLVEPVERDLVAGGCTVLFQHSGTFAMDDILTHTVQLSRSAIDLRGRYYGWQVAIDEPSSNSTGV